MPDRPSLVLFRRDLRLSDNPALDAAAAAGNVLPVFIFDENDPHFYGAAQRWALHHSLEALARAVRQAGGRLILRRGQMASALRQLASEVDARSVFWSRRYAPAQVEADTTLKAELAASGLRVVSVNGTLLREPWEVRTADGGPFQVFSAFHRALLRLGPARAEATGVVRFADSEGLASDDLSTWGLLPAAPNWAEEFGRQTTPGEAGARRRLSEFLDTAAGAYADRRDLPAADGTSGLSPHLALGEISIAEIWRAVTARVEAGDIPAKQGEKFLSELAWREFAYHLLFLMPDISAEPMRGAFRNFPYAPAPDAISAWRRGATGYPIVDAGMRQLWRTGWMHNRARMIAASFLTKHCLVPWQVGARWFLDTLVDADIANNSAGWQWVAGAGADAAPYFRIFNPTAQGEKFDPEGAYVRRYVPELARLPDAYVHRPWEAPAHTLRAAGVTLGGTYPRPIVDHAAARARALAAYETMRRAAG